MSIDTNKPSSPTPQQGEKELDDKLRELGYNPEQLGKRGETLARLLIENQDLKAKLAQEQTNHNFTRFAWDETCKERDALKTAQQPRSPALQGDDEVVNILGLDNPFPLRLVLQLLTKATKKLLHEKDYDGPDYEEMERCVTRANEIILLIDKYQSHSPAQPLTTDEEAASLYALEEAKACQSRTFTMSDTEYEKLHERAFLRGCTNVRSQQTNLKTDKP